jgi:hypothetical protein
MPRGGKREGAGRRPGSKGPHKRTLAIRRRIRQREDLTADVTIEQMRRGVLFDIRGLFDERGNLKASRAR